jgi:hypothetical protein
MKPSSVIRAGEYRSWAWSIIGLAFILILGGCSSKASPWLGQSSQPPSSTLLGSYEAHVTINPPTISFESVKPSDLNTQGLAITDLIAAAFPFKIRGSLSFAAGTATIAVTLTNTSLHRL